MPPALIARLNLDVNCDIVHRDPQQLKQVRDLEESYFGPIDGIVLQISMLDSAAAAVSVPHMHLRHTRVVKIMQLSNHTTIWGSCRSMQSRIRALRCRFNAESNVPYRLPLRCMQDFVFCDRFYESLNFIATDQHVYKNSA